MFQEFDKYLSLSFSEDYWSDEGIGIAEKKIAKFSLEDWHQLRIASEKRETLWLVRCADVLGDCKGKLSLEILMLLVRSIDIEVRIAALDSINSQLSMMKFDKNIAEELKSIVEKIEYLDPIDEIMISSLKTKLVAFG